MKFLKFLKNLWLGAASSFTAIATLLCLFILILSMSDPNSSLSLLDPIAMLRILLLSLFMGAGSALIRLDGMDKNLGICLHAALYNVGFFIFMWLSVNYTDGNNSRLATATIGTIIFAVIYTATMVAINLIPKAIKAKQKKSASKNSTVSTAKEAEKAKQKPKKSEKTPYTNQFS